jgi:hypothetical protein
MEVAFGGVLVTIFLAGFGYLAAEIKGLRENEIKSVRAEIKDLRESMQRGFSELTDRYIAHLERHR